MSKKLFAAGVVILALTHESARAKVILDVSPSTSVQFTGSAVIGGQFIVSNSFAQPTGSGVIDPFLRLQQPNDQTTQERGFNTNVSGTLDDKPPFGGFTRTLQLSEVPILRINGVDYREFLLDINQVANGNISLNQVQIFQSHVDLGTTAFTLQEADATHDAVIGFPALNPVFQINFRQNNGVDLALNTELIGQSGHGSGSGDLILYAAAADFANDPTSNITLFSQFGSPTGTFGSNDGFEEWYVREGVPPPGVPEPSSVVMLATGLASIAGIRRLRRRVGA